MTKFGYWKAEVNGGNQEVYVDSQNFVHFRDAGGCIHWNDFDSIDLLERIPEEGYWAVESK